MAILKISSSDVSHRKSAYLPLLNGGGEVTVKKLHREGGEADDLVRLSPRDGDHEDIVVSADSVRIQGEVVYVIHPPRR